VGKSTGSHDWETQESANLEFRRFDAESNLVVRRPKAPSREPAAAGWAGPH
jgi:hypothetical protein